MSAEPYRPALMPGYKWARFFRLQYAVRQTAANRARALAGQGQKGRPRLRLVSIDIDDLYMVPVDWTLEDAGKFAARYGVGPYYAAFMDGEYFAFPRGEASPGVITALLDEGRLVVLPKEGLARW